MFNIIQYIATSMPLITNILPEEKRTKCKSAKMLCYRNFPNIINSKCRHFVRTDTAMAGACEEPKKAIEATQQILTFILFCYMFDVTVLQLICYAVHFLSSFCARLAVSRLQPIGYAGIFHISSSYSSCAVAGSTIPAHFPHCPWNIAVRLLKHNVWLHSSKSLPSSRPFFPTVHMYMWGYCFRLY